MRGVVNIPEDSSLWPDLWKTVYFKTYDRFPKIVLPNPSLDVDFASMVMKRSSVREYSKDPLTLDQISNILYYSCGVTRKASDPQFSHRAQGSAGARYPVEVYLINFIEGDLKKRVYHYNVRDHVLDELWEYPENFHIFGYPWAHTGGMAIILTGVTWRTTMKYGERGYRYMYYEAGGIANTMNLLSAPLGLGSTILGGTQDEKIEELLDLDGERETVLLGLAIGNRKENTRV